jgi:hypothetical protein
MGNFPQIWRLLGNGFLDGFLCEKNPALLCPTIIRTFAVFWLD